MSLRDQDQPDKNLATSVQVKAAGVIGEKEPSRGQKTSNGTQQSDNFSSSEDYPRGVKLALLLLSIYLSVFLVALDRTIIATALPEITDHFKSLADIGWVSLVHSARSLVRKGARRLTKMSC